MEIEKKTCCFLGHRKIVETEELKKDLYKKIEELIINKKVTRFLFGSKSEFDNLCLKIVTGLKEKYPHIKCIYVRAEFPYIDGEYREYLLRFYDDTYYPKKMLGAGRSSYVERNYEMIDNSSFCVIYYDEKGLYKSGTKIAYEYAQKKRKEVHNVFPITL